MHAHASYAALCKWVFDFFIMASEGSHAACCRIGIRKTAVHLSIPLCRGRKCGVHGLGVALAKVNDFSVPAGICISADRQPVADVRCGRTPVCPLFTAGFQHIDVRAVHD